IEDKPNFENDRKLAQHILKTHKNRTIEYEIEPELLRKYIGYARNHCKPILTEAAAKVLEEFYVEVRGGGVDEDAPVPITARQLEAIIRLAEASAKLQLKDEVDADDALRAIRLQQECLRQVGYDPDTGKIDIDRAVGGTPRSDRDKLNKVVEEISKLEELEGAAPIGTLKEIMQEEYEVSEEKLTSILKQLKSKGIIYEPTSGSYKKVD
ncbi:MAG: AAA family ATPase, partial [archaeon]|nr:AAA family ATPase [archaeon]